MFFVNLQPKINSSFYRDANGVKESRDSTEHRTS